MRHEWGDDERCVHCHSHMMSVEDWSYCPKRGESSATGGEHDERAANVVVSSITETEHRSACASRADSQGKGGGKGGALANPPSTGTVEQRAPRFGHSDIDRAEYLYGEER